ncbi:uncharacterized protein [Nicotiana tomentosiformis]|uniref:uncharacterized protein n=1 Tax=Nicotiana tomentosiformis TaxID=4098 RepID=UPI00388CC96D
MPSYAKFLKEILSSKRKLKEVSVVKLTEKCSAILQNKLPQKLGDPESFTIPCTVGGTHFEKALCDSVDQSTKRPKGIIENILVRVDRFVFPVDFIVLEIEENTEVPLILGRPFLAPGRAIIDVHQEQLILRVDEERVIFDIQKLMKFPGDESSSSCFQIDLCLARSDTISDDNSIIKEKAEILEKESENEKVSQEGVQLKIEFKDLSSHLKYVFLKPELFPVIISSSLTIEQESKLIGVLRKHKRALGWTIDDIKGISPAICIHRNLMENDYKPIVQPQRRLNPAMQEVVKKEVVKLLAGGIVYPISDSPWVSPVQVVPKKGGYGFYYFLDGSSGYNQIPIAPEDQEKTTFTCPQDMTEKFLEIFMDDFTLFEGIVLGHKIFIKGIEVDKAKIDLIEGLPPPTTVKGIRSFLGHAALKYLLAKKDARLRLLRWILLLQEFDLKIKDRKGSENQEADHLSRLENPPNEIEDKKEEFSDEHIFLVTTVINRPPWFADIANYLAGGWIPKDFSYEQKKKY